MAWLVALLVGDGTHPLVTTLIADVAATLVVFLGSIAVDNASVYDPYWSVAPPVIVAAWIATDGGGDGARRALVLGLLAVWAVRLTGNWVHGWRGLVQEDWRYVRLRRPDVRGPMPWWVVNLGGIQLLPTLLVLAALVPAWPAVTDGSRGFGVLDVLAVLVTAGAIVLEAGSDEQRRRFALRPENAGRRCDVGFWRFSKHPNYVGEMSLWWGIWLFGLAADPSWWPTVAGPLAMVALFVFASIPMMDARNRKRRPEPAA